MALLNKIKSELSKKIGEYKCGLSNKLYGLKEKAKSASPTTYGVLGSVTGGLVSYASNPEAINLLKDGVYYVKDGAESTGLIAGLGILSAVAKKGYNIATGRDARDKMLKEEGVYKARTHLEKQLDHLNKLIVDAKDDKEDPDLVKELRINHAQVKQLYLHTIAGIEAFKNKKTDSIYMPTITDKKRGSVDIDQNAAETYLVDLKKNNLYQEISELKIKKKKVDDLSSKIKAYEMKKSDIYEKMRILSDVIKPLEKSVASGYKSTELKNLRTEYKKNERVANRYETNLKELRKQVDEINTNDVKNADSTIRNREGKIKSLDKLRIEGL
ncbi:MAG: hypothetical protein ABIG84_01420 [archaeon]